MAKEPQAKKKKTSLDEQIEAQIEEHEERQKSEKISMCKAPCISCGGETKRHKITFKTKVHWLAGTRKETREPAECLKSKHYCWTCIENIVVNGVTCGQEHRKDQDHCWICRHLKTRWRQQKVAIAKKEQRDKEKRRMPNLQELCARQIAKYPQLILYTATSGINKESTWEIIEKNIPPLIGTKYYSELAQYQKEHGRAMYRTLGKMFGKFHQKGSRAFVDCNSGRGPSSEPMEE